MPRKQRVPPPPVTEDTPLSLLEERFAAEYVVDLNGRQAAIRAGHAAAGAAVAASRHLTKPNVAKAVQKLHGQKLEVAGLTADAVLAELARIVFANVNDLFDAEGRLVNPKKLDRRVTAAIASIEVTSRTLDGDANEVEYVHKYKFWNKNNALEAAMRHLGKHVHDPEAGQTEVPAFALPADTPGVSVH